MRAKPFENLRRFTPRQHRGQAMVEMTVSLVVAVPLLLFTMFLQDYTLHYLDWQETVVTPAWDAYSSDYVNAQMSYTRINPPAWSATSPTNHQQTYAASVSPMFAGTPEAKVQSVARLSFCDHTSAKNSSGAFSPGNHLTSAAYDPIASRGSPDCGGKALNSIGGHPSWTVGPSRQVRCTQEPARTAELVPGFAGRTEAAQSGDRRGGIISCTSRLSVVNMILPNRTLFGWGGEQNITDKTRHRAGDPDSAAASSSWTFGHGRGADNFAVLHDSWSVNSVMNIDTRYVTDRASPSSAHSYQYGEGDRRISGGSYGDTNNPGENFQRNPFWKRVQFFYYGEIGGPRGGATATQRRALDQAHAFGTTMTRTVTVAGLRVGALSPEAIQDGPFGNDPRTATLVYRRQDRFTSGNYSRSTGVSDFDAAGRYGHQRQNFSFDLEHTPFTARSTGQYAAGWDDPNQRRAWNRRQEEYFGREWRDWVDP